MRSGWTFKQTGFTFGHKGDPPVAPIGGCPQGAEPYFCDHERATVRNLLVRELKHTSSVDPMPGLLQSEQNIEYFLHHRRSGGDRCGRGISRTASLKNPWQWPTAGITDATSRLLR